MSHPFPYDSDYAPPAPILTINVIAPGKRPKSETLQALVDTGADLTLLPLNLLQRINAPLSYLIECAVCWGNLPLLIFTG